MIKGLAIGLAVVFFALMIGCIAVANDDNDSLGKIQLITHEGSDCYQGDCYDQDNGSDYGNHGDQSRCRGPNCRGSFSPGPFDRSPVDIHDNQVCISPDCSGSSGDRDKQREGP